MSNKKKHQKTTHAERYYTRLHGPRPRGLIPSDVVFGQWFDIGKMEQIKRDVRRDIRRFPETYGIATPED
jgi:hypothetical protein